MFEPSVQPRVFGVAPGADFPRAVIDGLLERLDGRPPDALARVTIVVNTRRMQRRMHEIFGTLGPGLVPRIRVLSDLAADVPVPGLEPAVPPLRRQWELAQLVAGLLEKEPDLAPRTAAFDLGVDALLDVVVRSRTCCGDPGSLTGSRYPRSRGAPHRQRLQFRRAACRNLHVARQSDRRVVDRRGDFMPIALTNIVLGDRKSGC